MKFPKPLKITSRTSSITNAFVQAIIPFEAPTPDELRDALAYLEMTPESISCSYCGNIATDWDHLRPLVRDKKPTGHISNYKNLVPSCAPCNQSKSGADWRAWMNGKARKGPGARGISDLELRIERLAKFEQWGSVKEIDIDQLIDPELRSKYWTALEHIKLAMSEAQKTADEVRQQVEIRLSAVSKEKLE